MVIIEFLNWKTQKLISKDYEDALAIAYWQVE